LIAKGIKNSGKVVQIGTSSSPDVFGNITECALWRKV